MEMIILKALTQPVDSATLYDVFVGGDKRAVRIVAADGFELVREDEEPNGIRSVDIPAMYEERVNLYKAIPLVVKPDEPEIEVEEPEVKEQATEADYINALEELGVSFNE